MILFVSTRSNDCHCQCQTSGERCFDLGWEGLGRKEIVLNSSQSLLVCNQNEQNESCSSPFYTNIPDSWNQHHPGRDLFREGVHREVPAPGNSGGEEKVNWFSGCSAAPLAGVVLALSPAPDGVLCAVLSSAWCFLYFFTSL